MKIKVGVLGATGMVGQRFIQLLNDHPWFEISSLTASKRSEGKRYSEAAKWYIEGEMPEQIRDMEVLPTKPDIDVDLVFSALPSDVAKTVEPEFAKKGIAVASNASAHRMEEDIPLIIPEVNPEHLALIEEQKKKRKWDGFIVTNPNCSTIMLTLSLKPIDDMFSVKEVAVVTMQAISGAGYSGVPSMAILGNIIPYIGKEEEKMESEPLKILGKVENKKVKNANIKISAACNRVPVVDGHTEAVFVKLEEKAGVKDIIDAFESFKGAPQRYKLPTAPEKPIYVMQDITRPQPRIDVMVEKGMAVSVGRIRTDKLFDFKWVVLGHNTIRGAAGASVLNAELLVKEGYI